MCLFSTPFAPPPPTLRSRARDLARRAAAARATPPRSAPAASAIPRLSRDIGIVDSVTPTAKGNGTGKLIQLDANDGVLFCSINHNG